MSPVKSTAPTEYGVSWMFDGCRPASPPSAPAHSGSRTDQPHAGAGRVVVHLPVGRVERVDVLGREELGRGVRPVEHAELPLPRSAPGAARPAPATPVVRRSVGHRARSTSPGRSARPPCPPKPPRVNVAALPEILGHVEAAREQHVGPQPGAGDRPESSTAPAGYGRPASRHRRRAVERDVGLGAGRRTPWSRALNRRAGPSSVHSSPAAPSGLPRARLPSRNERSSIGRSAGRRRASSPSRPGQACTVVIVPAAQDLDPRRRVGRFAPSDAVVCVRRAGTRRGRAPLRSRPRFVPIPRRGSAASAAGQPAPAPSSVSAPWRPPWPAAGRTRGVTSVPVAIQCRRAASAGQRDLGDHARRSAGSRPPGPRRRPAPRSRERPRGAGRRRRERRTSCHRRPRGAPSTPPGRSP